ncbi:MAG TPA: OmpH family outer membrane protein [Terracidiphilus sp.]|nr:OmpH family outer membrane protein [Terracidiphilus sp.]
MNRPAACAAVLLSGLALAAAAQTPSTSTTTKVAVIAFQTAVTQTNEFQRDFADLQRKYEPKRTELKTLNDQIDALKKQLQTQADTLSDADRESRARVINDKERDLQRDQQDDQSDYQQDMQQTFNTVATKVGAVLDDYAKQHNYTVVLDAGNPETQVVLYVGPGTDVTKAIIDAYNAKSGVPAPPASAPAAPRPSTTHPGATHPQH